MDSYTVLSPLFSPVNTDHFFYFEKRDSACCICKGETPTVLYIPCGHISTCKPCSKIWLQKKEELNGLLSCPLCTIQTTQTANVYFNNQSVDVIRDEQIGVHEEADKKELAQFRKEVILII